MALAFEILAIIGFFIAVLLFIGFIGIIIIIISSAERRKARRAGMKPKNAGLVTGLVMLAVPVDTFVFAVMIAAIGMMKTQIQRTTYDCCTDKWRNETVYENTARKEVIDEFLEAADKNDTETLKKLFAQTIQEDSKLDEQLEEFMVEYPSADKLSEADYDIKGGSSGSSYDDGEATRDFSASCVVTVGEKSYYIYFGGVNQDTANPENVGLEYFKLYSDEAQALTNRKDYVNESTDLYIYSKTDVPGEINTRTIDNWLYEYNEYDRTITAEQAKSVCLYRDIDGVIEELGTPNAISYRVCWAYYEITPDDDDSTKDPYYVYISFDEIHGTLYHAYFVYDKDGTDTDYDTDLVPQ